METQLHKLGEDLSILSVGTSKDLMEVSALNIIVYPRYLILYEAPRFLALYSISCSFIVTMDTRKEYKPDMTRTVHT
jgi:hypothetical protein